MSVEFKTEGFDELFKKMNDLAEEIGKGKTDRIWRNAMSYAIEPVLQDAKAYAPKDTGQLAENIYSAVHKPKTRDKASASYMGEMYMARVTASPNREKDILVFKLNKNGKFQTFRTNKKPVPVSQEFGNKHLENSEFGTAERGAHPFLRPAMKNNIDKVISRLGQAIWSEIQWGKYNSDKSKG